MEFTITSTENSFITNPVIVVNHFAMVTDYEFKDVPFEELFLNETVRIDGVSSQLGTVLVQSEMVSTTNNTMDVKLTINPNRPDLEGLNYKISVLVGDSTIPSNSTDKVQLSIDSGAYSDAFDIEGLIGNAEIDLYLKDCDDLSIDGSSSFPMIKGELINTKFILPVIDGTIDTITLDTIAIDSGVIYQVDTINIDTSGFKIIDGVQRIDEVLPSPYNSSINGSIKWVSGTTYEIIMPYIMPYDEQVPVEGLPDILFDNTLPNDGQNQDVYYMQTKGLNIHISYTVGMIKDGRTTYYRFRTPVIQIKDFEQPI